MFSSMAFALFTARAHLIHNMQGACHHLEQREHREQLALPPKGERVAWIEAFFYLTIPLLEQLLTLS